MFNRLHQSEKIIDELRRQGVMVDLDNSGRPTRIFPSTEIDALSTELDR